MPGCKTRSRSKTLLTVNDALIAIRNAAYLAALACETHDVDSHCNVDECHSAYISAVRSLAKVTKTVHAQAKTAYAKALSAFVAVRRRFDVTAEKVLSAEITLEKARDALDEAKFEADEAKADVVFAKRAVAVIFSDYSYYNQDFLDSEQTLIHDEHPAFVFHGGTKTGTLYVLINR